MNMQTKLKVVEQLPVVKDVVIDTPIKDVIINTPKFTLAQLIVELNGDLAKEYQAMIQYIQHAACLVGPAMLNIAEELRAHADDEHRHAVLIADHINYLGGVPTASADITIIATDSVTALHYDITAEQTAIARYTERAVQATELGEIGTAQLLKTILVEEQGHENDLMVVLGLKRGTKKA
jgi:bacterioferritin